MTPNDRPYDRADPRPVLVVGLGFLGTAITTALAAEGMPARILTRRRRTVLDEAWPGARQIVGDAGSPATVHDALDGVRAVMYCAGSALPAQVEEDPPKDLRESLAPLLTLLEGLRRGTPVPFVFFSSGGTVYGEPPSLPVPEDAPRRPTTAYSAGKVAAEDYLDTYRRREGVPAVALRCSNVYGPGQRPYRSQGVIATLLASAAAGRPVTLYGDGSAVRDHVAVEDVARAAVRLLDEGSLPSAINVGSGVGTRLDDLIALVEQVTHTCIERTFLPPRPTDLERIVLDITLLKGLIPFEPCALADGITRWWESGELQIRT